MRRMIGVFLAAASIVLCLIPILSETSPGQVYRVSAQTHWPMETTGSEINGPVRINDADEEELTLLPGIGETISSMIVEERTKNGLFYYAEDLEAVRGIGLRTLQRFRHMIDLSQYEREEKDGIPCTLP